MKQEQDARDAEHERAKDSWNALPDVMWFGYLPDPTFSIDFSDSEFEADEQLTY
jgi:hypothetical protein